jgi:hypothetical protein
MLLDICSRPVLADINTVEGKKIVQLTRIRSGSFGQICPNSKDRSGR